MKQMNFKIFLVIFLILVVLTGGYFLLTGKFKVSPPTALGPVGNTSSQTGASTSTTTPPPLDSESQIPGQVTVQLTASGFVPANVTVRAGTTVVWVNASGAQGAVYSNPHPIHTDYPPLNLGVFQNGGTFSLLFDKAGTYGYHNHLNPGQTGTIVVQ